MLDTTSAESSFWYNLDMNLLFLMNAYKGTMTSTEMNSILQSHFQKDKTESIPFSDGGDGFLDMIEALSPTFAKRKENVLIQSPYLEKERKATYLIINDKAYIESASAIGYRLEEKKDVLHATSYPLGEMILDAIRQHVQEIYVGLGGSITNDMGSGMLEALGTVFYDKDHHQIHPMGNNLNQIQDMDIDALRKTAANIKIHILSDVDNPLLGKNGATYVYARQKGAKEEELPQLEEAMENLASLYRKTAKKDCSEEKGAGAAGGIGMALLSFFDSDIQSGTDYLLSSEKMERLIKHADMIFTGEGKMDSSSLDGKGPFLVLKKRNEWKAYAKIIFLVGSIEETTKKTLSQEYTNFQVIEMLDDALSYPVEERKEKAKEIFEKTLRKYF